MPVANGAEKSGLGFSKRYRQANGTVGGPQYYTTYVRYTENANTTITATTYLLYQKPRSIDNTQNPPDAKTTGGIFGNDNMYIAAGVLENGKVTALKNNQTQYLTNEGKLKTYVPPTNEAGNYVLSNIERSEMVSQQKGSLNDLTKNNAVTVLTNENGISYARAKGAINKGVAPPAAAPVADPQGGTNGSAGNGGAAGQTLATTATPSTDETLEINSKELDVPNKDQAFYDSLNFSTLSYPYRIESSGADVLKIEILQYVKSEIDKANLTINRPKDKQTSKGTIYLGLQASITDQNTVNWTNDSSMDAIQMGAASVALNFMQDGDVSSALNNVGNALLGTADRSKASSTFGQAFLAKIASGTGNGNLFTRVTGAIVNPNVELLFNAPQLRPFSFSFNLSPRGPTEAQQVKAIIKALKQSSAVQIGVGQLFLKTPFIYKLTYMTKPDEGNLMAHPSINRIKQCALTSINIDYTPANVYMTYKDKERTMTSYTMQLQFTELDPIYGDDYKDSAAVGSIGY